MLFFLPGLQILTTYDHFIDMKGSFPPVEDIESFRKWGQENQTCPYFLSKEQKTDADIIFMPYNYVLDPLIRKTLGIDLTGSVIILDEAHNVESVAADCGSFEITNLDLQGCIEELTKCLDVYGAGATAAPPPPVAPEAPDLASNLPIKLDDINKLVTSESGALTGAPDAGNAPIAWNFNALKGSLST
jgi:Rad3-related DNA helicase